VVDKVRVDVESKRVLKTVAVNFIVAVKDPCENFFS
jgi:hypothetical protein